MQNTIIFNSQQPTTKNSSPLKILIFKLIATVLIVIALYLIVNYKSFFQNSLFYFVALIVGIVLIQVLIYLFVFNYSKKVTSLEMTDYSLEITYLKNNKEFNVSLPINSTKIELFELKDYKSYYYGLQMNLKNSYKMEKLKLKEEIWSYEDFEAIYTEFKKRKHESIPENEISAFKQLQIMNGTDSKTVE